MATFDHVTAWRRVVVLTLGLALAAAALTVTASSVLADPMGNGPVDNVDNCAVANVNNDAVPTVEQAKLTGSDTEADDRFGRSVAISGNTAVIGAGNDDNDVANFSGSAYIFARCGATWTQRAKLIASDAAAGDSFGHSVAIFGDTALVGNPFDTHTGGFSAGSAYVFVRSGTTWTNKPN